MFHRQVRVLALSRHRDRVASFNHKTRARARCATILPTPVAQRPAANLAALLITTITTISTLRSSRDTHPAVASTLVSTTTPTHRRIRIRSTSHIPRGRHRESRTTSLPAGASRAVLEVRQLPAVPRRSTTPPHTILMRCPSCPSSNHSTNSHPHRHLPRV